MTSITAQRDLIVSFKKETLSNVGILSKVHSMPTDLSRQIFKENALEKPTQNVFNHLSYYLVNIIDFQASSSLPWPLYDTKTERSYRNEFANFLTEYSSKGLLSPVMSSYLVNPGCYKVTVLIFQLSQLAVQRVLINKMHKESQKKLYTEMTERYTQNGDGFMDSIEKETASMLCKFSNYLSKRNALEKIAALLRKKITEMEEKLASLKAQEYIDNLVDKFVKQNNFDSVTKKELLKLKDVKTDSNQSQILECWLCETDSAIELIEQQWNERMGPLIRISQETAVNTKALIARNTGEADKSTYMIEYNPKTDHICTNDLQNQVNSQQKFILKNIAIDDRLSFPNLIRGFLISIYFILKSTDIGDEIFKFNKYMEGGKRDFGEIVLAMRSLLDRVMNAEERLQSTPIAYNRSLLVKDYVEIPPLPDLSDLKASRELQSQVFFETFTPLSLTKHQFNLRRKISNSFIKPKPKSLITPFHQAPRDEFLKSIISCRVSSYDRPNVSQNFHNLSVISQATSRGNETIAECSAGFTKQQIMRLLSTKKSSSSKKNKFKTDRPSNIKIKKGNLFNESNVSVSGDSNGLFRSYSSPNLIENREPISRIRGRKLSIMQEDSPSLLEVSGISSLDKNNSGTPRRGFNLESTRHNESALRHISPSVAECRINQVLKQFEDDLNAEIKNASTESALSRNNSGLPKENLDNTMQQNYSESLPHIVVTPAPYVDEEPIKIDKWEVINKESSVLKDKDVKPQTANEMQNITPKANVSLSRKTSSLEKIINRFKKVRAYDLQTDNTEEDMNEFTIIEEEKENMNTVNVDVFTANKVLLPDLLSPSCNTQKTTQTVKIKSTEFLDELCFDVDERIQKERRKPRESLGTALGVDQTFLDQFDLID